MHAFGYPPGWEHATPQPAEGVAALTRSVTTLTEQLGERDDEIERLKAECERARAETSRARKQLNEKYSSEAENVLKTASAAQLEAAKLVEAGADRRLDQFARQLEDMSNRAALERSLLAAELSCAEQKVAALERPLATSLLGWLSVPPGDG